MPAANQRCKSLGRPRGGAHPRTGVLEGDRDGVGASAHGGRDVEHVAAEHVVGLAHGHAVDPDLRNRVQALEHRHDLRSFE